MNHWMRLKRCCFLIAVGCASLGWTFAQDQRAALALRAAHMPMPVLIDGKSTAYYELDIDNLTRDSVALTGLQVIRESDHSILATFDKDDLRRRFANTTQPRGKKGMLGPDDSGVVYVEIEFPVGNTRVTHRLDADVVNGGQVVKSFSVEGGVLQRAKGSPVVLGRPLRGGPWVAIYEPSWERGHRRVRFTTDGEQHLPGRFAIDFVLADTLGHFAHDNDDETHNWYGYGAPVLAVSDGVVVATRNDFMESLTLSAHPDYPASRATGNYVALDIGNNRIVFYEHLQPGSIAVKSGQRIKQGDVIGAIGFTGQTTGPHLHLHVADKNSPLGAEGMPFVFDRFTLQGAYPTAAGLGSKPWVPVDTQKNVVRERPGPNAVIFFAP